MVIFNSYVKLPEGKTNFPTEPHECRWMVQVVLGTLQPRLAHKNFLQERKDFLRFLATRQGQHNMCIWLVVWDMNFIFPYIGGLLPH